MIDPSMHPVAIVIVIVLMLAAILPIPRRFFGTRASPLRMLVTDLQRGTNRGYVVVALIGCALALLLGGFG